MPNNTQEYTREHAQEHTQERVYAGFAVRLAAYLVDLLLVSVVLLVVRVPLWIVKLASPENILVRDLVFQFSLADIVTYLLRVLYFVFFTYQFGATVGKKCFHLRVEGSDGQKLSLFDVIYRESIGRFLCSVVMEIGYLLVVVDKHKRGLHDILCDTEVVYYHEVRDYQYAVPQHRYMNPPSPNTLQPQEDWKDMPTQSRSDESDQSDSRHDTGKSGPVDAGFWKEASREVGMEILENLSQKDETEKGIDEGVEKKQETWKDFPAEKSQDPEETQTDSSSQENNKH